MKRGDVYWFEPDPVRGSEQAGRRPAIVMSRDAVNQASPVVIVVPITTFRGQPLYPSDVLIQPPDGGLNAPSIALALQIRAIDKQRLKTRLGALKLNTLGLIENAILQVLDIGR